MPNQPKRIALVTGANKGIGLEVCRQLGRAGCIVLLAARNAQLGEQAAATLREAGSEVRFVELDLEQPQTIQAAAASVDREFSQLDILVNNAGIADRADGPPSAAAIDAVQRTLQTNFLGALMVTQAMLPLLRKSSAGRIVNVSSGLGSLGLNSDPHWEHASVKFIGYSASKAALNMLTVQLAYELRDTPIRVNSVEPGYTATDLNGNRGPDRRRRRGRDCPARPFQ